MWGSAEPEQVAWPRPVSADLPGHSYPEPQLQQGGARSAGQVAVPAPFLSGTEGC